MAVLASVLILVLSLVAAAFYSYVLDRSPIDPVALHLPPHPKPAGVFAHNTLLQGVEKLEGLPQPEDMALDPSGKFLYTGTSDGWIKKVHLVDGAVEDWKHVGGRPLGIAVGNAGEVLVCEPLQGLLKVTEEGVEVLSTEAEGTKFLLVDGVAVAKDGLIYFTDASSKYGVGPHWHDNFEGRPHGRILVYDPTDGSTTVLVRDLYFPNGVALARDDEFLVVCETPTARCGKHFLKGERRGESEPFVENLPGFPDNIHYDGKGLFYIGLIANRDAISDFIFRTPFLKRLLACYPSLYDALDTSGRMGRVLAVDERGKPVQMYEDPTGKVVGFVTAGVEVDGHLYVGGLRDNFIGRIKVQ